MGLSSLQLSHGLIPLINLHLSIYLSSYLLLVLPLWRTLTDTDFHAEKWGCCHNKIAKDMEAPLEPGNV